MASNLFLLDYPKPDGQYSTLVNNLEFNLKLTDKNGNEIGRLFTENGVLTFKGECDESAKVFFEAVIAIHKQKFGTT